MDIASTEWQGRSVFEFARDAHILCCFYHIGDAYFLSKFHRNGVDALCKSCAERDVGIRKSAVGVVWTPDTGFAFFVYHIHLDVFVFETCIRGEPSLFHGCGIDKHLEGRTRLVSGFHIVVLPCVEINVSHIGFHLSRLRFHSYETSVHEVQHIAQRIDRRHFSLYMQIRIRITEKLYFVGSIQQFHHLIGFVGIARR